MSMTSMTSSFKSYAFTTVLMKMLSEQLNTTEEYNVYTEGCVYDRPNEKVNKTAFSKVYTLESDFECVCLE